MSPANMLLYILYESLASFNSVQWLLTSYFFNYSKQVFYKQTSTVYSSCKYQILWLARLQFNLDYTYIVL